MKRYRQWVTVGVVLSTAGVLAGCGNTNSTAANNTIQPPSKVSNQTAATNNTVSEQVPNWFLNDLKIASSVHFPITVQTYLLNLNYPYVYASKWFKAPARNLSQTLWLGSYTGTQSEKGYIFYNGTWDMTKLYKEALSKPTPWLGSVTPIYMLENHSDIHGHFVPNAGHLIPAASVDLGNGCSLAFAPNQVILQSNHAAVNQYTVIPVQGITLPQ